jgi:hypothetical protein
MPFSFKILRRLEQAGCIPFGDLFPISRTQIAAVPVDSVPVVKLRSLLAGVSLDAGLATVIILLAQPAFRQCLEMEQNATLLCDFLNQKLRLCLACAAKSWFSVGEWKSPI